MLIAMILALLGETSISKSKENFKKAAIIFYVIKVITIYLTNLVNIANLLY